MKKAKILLVDDHPIVRQGLAQLINQEPDLAVCGTCRGWRTARSRAIAAHRPDIVILDISLNGPDGLSVLKDIRLSDPALPVLVLSMHDESLYAERALRAGANGYIMKQEATEKVLEAIRRIRGGEVYVSDRIAKRLLRQIVSSPASGKSPMEALTDRELAVFRSHRQRARHARDRRRPAHQRQNRGVVPGAYQGKAVAEECPRTGTARVSVGDQRRRAVTCARLQSGNPRLTRVEDSPHPETARCPIERRSAG